ncbi:helix-turn-helix transcriptional regulator [candidate division KSB1 bacterium]|nr:helix-turn-helix transcriptional regulator [candidate division KSB1 bacterium]MCH8285995.1 helix-turn-helix transcriptional regulator [candidate division KSB1 bacterium]
MTLTKLRKLRKINEITLDEVALDTGLSIGYINRIERGYITEIKNEVKRKRLESYISDLERKTKLELSLT